MANNTPQSAVGYIRVSTVGQAMEGVSLDAQREAIQRYADLHGHKLASVHADEGLSGKRADNRPALQAALTDVCRTRGVLVVYSLSRLARSTRDAIDIAERLDKCGADLAAIAERIDTASASGRLFFRIMASLAEFERDVISERTSAAMEHKRQRGERISGRIPYGYRLGPDAVALLPVEVEQHTIRRIMRERKAGASYHAIADKLNAAGIAAKAGGQWYAKVVRDVALRGIAE